MVYLIFSTYFNFHFILYDSKARERKLSTGCTQINNEQKSHQFYYP